MVPSPAASSVFLALNGDGRESFADVARRTLTHLLPATTRAAP
ncbi:hypothetical protein [Streptosporangium saharense]